MMTTNDVLTWLSDHPDFLIEHPELLDQLKLPHDAGTTSLIEHQVARLRQSNRQLEQRLATLTSIAGENEQLIRRLHTLSLQLMTQDAIEPALIELFRRLKEDFQTDAVTLHLNRALASSVEPEDVRIQSEWSETLTRLLERGEIECGRLTRTKIDALFGPTQGASLASVAVVPLERFGILAIGSESEDRFRPGMGTLFLELLGQTVISRLSNDTAPPRKRA